MFRKKLKQEKRVNEEKEIYTLRGNVELFFIVIYLCL